MNATPGNRGTSSREPSELEREADEIRADMDRTLDALERKFSPAQLLDRSLGYLREHGPQLTQNVGDTVKHNPLPVLMATAGVAWLIASSMSSRRQMDSGMYGDTPYDESGGLKSKIRERASAARDRVRSSRTVNRMSSAMHTRTDQVQQRMHGLVEEQPLVLGALAVAVGAIIGAALPSTEYENRTVGQVRDRTLAKAKQMGERQYDNLRSKLETHEDVQVSGRTN